MLRTRETPGVDPLDCVQGHPVALPHRSVHVLPLHYRYHAFQTTSIGDWAQRISEPAKLTPTNFQDTKRRSVLTPTRSSFAATLQTGTERATPATLPQTAFLHCSSLLVAETANAAGAPHSLLAKRVELRRSLRPKETDGGRLFPNEPACSMNSRIPVPAQTIATITSRIDFRDEGLTVAVAGTDCFSANPRTSWELFVRQEGPSPCADPTQRLGSTVAAAAAAAPSTAPEVRAKSQRAAIETEASGSCFPVAAGCCSVVAVE